MHQNDCRRVEHGQINGDTNFNNRFQDEKKRVCKNMHLKNLSENQRLAESRFVLKFWGTLKMMQIFLIL
jgi:hypothetical protein